MGLQMAFPLLYFLYKTDIIIKMHGLNSAMNIHFIYRVFQVTHYRMFNSTSFIIAI